MSSMSLNIDGHEIRAGESQTVMEAALANGIRIPALCHHPALKPIGACGLCVVEIPGPEGPITRPSCLLKVKDRLAVRTQSPLALEARNKAFRKIFQQAPQSRRLIELAREFDIDLPTPPDGCIRCRLCIRVCKDIVGREALKVEKGADGRLYINPVEDRCIGCGTCANLCPTGAIVVNDQDGFRTITIRHELISRHALTRCEICGRLFATEDFLKHVQVRSTDHHPDTKEHHAYCPTCIKLFSPRVRSSSQLNMR
jgi:bidirectional [NiFe] hydrogenase diaphorase subunit